MCFFFFFCQAEDGIRYLVRSRGLGDVYKRQICWCVGRRVGWSRGRSGTWLARSIKHSLHYDCIVAVSYTHLTLPTSDLV